MQNEISPAHSVRIDELVISFESEDHVAPIEGTNPRRFGAIDPATEKCIHGPALS
jgi:hypothetical protein